MDGSYTIRATGVFQLDKSVFPTDSAGYRDWRGSVESAGQFKIGDQWVWGWDGTALSDRNFLYDYGMLNALQAASLLKLVPDFVLSQAYIAGRGDRSYFEARAMYFYGLSAADVQGQLPIVHPVIDHDFVAKDPVLAGELQVRTNLTSLSRQSANFDPISTLALASNACGLTTADTALLNRSNCLLRGVPGEYDRLSSEMSWRRTIVDPLGELWIPFVMVRGDVANINVADQPGVSNYIHVGQEDLGRVMPTAGLEYRYPLINVQQWGTQTIQPIAQLIFRPNETQVGAFPNEDAQSLIFDDSNLFKINKFSGWDRVEGGGRANVGVEYTAQFNRGGTVNVLFGQSYQLYGQNSFAMGGTTNTGLDTGLDTRRSDYVARASYQPNATLTLTSRFRFGESDFTLQRTELEATANFGRWTTQVMYGDYAAQPEIGFLNRREGILGSARLKVTENWVLLGAAQYDLIARSVSQTQIGVGYVDDCLILALNYITSYAYSGSVSVNHTFMMQITLRTLGGSTSNQSPSAVGTGVGLPGLH
jgi:LPS-assembly protein